MVYAADLGSVASGVEVRVLSKATNRAKVAGNGTFGLLPLIKDPVGSSPLKTKKHRKTI